MATSIYDQIVNDYVGPLSHAEATRQELARWRESTPALADLTDLADLDQSVKANPDAVLGALLDLHQAGSQLAGTMLLHQMLPKLRLLTRFARVYHEFDRGDDERRAIVLTAFLSVIATYRARRGLAGALSLQTLRAITPKSPAATEIPWYTPSDPGEDDLLAAGDVLDPRSDPAHDEQDLCDVTGDQLLSWAHQSGVVSAEERDLLARAYLADDQTIAELADQLGVSYAGLRARLHRLVTRIRRAVSDQAVTALRDPSPLHAPLCRAA